MATVTDFSGNSAQYDYLIVGGGTAGCLLAARLAESLPEFNILMVERGASDLGRSDLHDLKNQTDTWGGDSDYQYRSTQQFNGESAPTEQDSMGCGTDTQSDRKQPSSAHTWKDSGRMLERERLYLVPAAGV